MSSAPDPQSPQIRPPFWRHRYAYMFLKAAVIVIGLYIAFRLFG